MTTSTNEETCVLLDTIYALCKSIKVKFLVVDSGNTNDDGTIDEVAMGLDDVFAFFDPTDDNIFVGKVLIELASIKDFKLHKLTTHAAWMVKRLDIDAEDD